MAATDVDPEWEDASAECGQLTPQAVVRTLGQMEARAARASDETLTSAVGTGRRALAEWQDLAERRRELQGEYERLTESESRALARLRDVLYLLDRFTKPARPPLAPARPGGLAPGGPTMPTRPHLDTAGVLAVRMLGPFELTIGGRRVVHWQGQRTQALMQFLTARRHRHVSRDELIIAMWPEAGEDSGRHRLHQAVYELRGTLRAVDPDRKPIICADGGYGLDPSVPIWVDVEEFDALAETVSRHLAARQAGDAIGSGRKALELYRGDFLCHVTDADWATAERNRLRARFAQLSVHLGELLAERGDHGAALAIVHPVLSMEPWNEDATVVMMRCHAQTGERSLAVAAYRSCAAALHGEFGVRPAARTVRAYEEIRAAEPAGTRQGLSAGQGRKAARPPMPPAPGAARPAR